MKDDLIETLCKRLGVLDVGFSPRQRKEALAATLIEKRDPIFTCMIPQLCTLTDSKLDIMIEDLAYKEAPQLFDLPTKRRRPEVPILIVSQIVRTVIGNAWLRWSPETAAKHLHPKWKHHYSKPENMASRFYQIRDGDIPKQQTELDAERPNLRANLRSQITEATSDDLRRFAEALTNADGDEEKIKTALLSSVDMTQLTEAEQLLAVKLALIESPVFHVWVFAGDPIERCNGEDKPINFILDLLRGLKLFKGKKQR